jgi:hypothetical protein
MEPVASVVDMLDRLAIAMFEDEPQIAAVIASAAQRIEGER